MSTNILMPALSPTMTEGKLTRWLKQPGDAVAPGDVIAEIETDKATMEVEAVDEGRIGEIRVPEGTENIPVNAVIATLLAEGEEPGAPATLAAQPAKAAPAPAPDVRPAGASPAPPAPARAAANGHDLEAPRSRIAASPLARRLARDAGIDLATVQGSGPHGRIIKADLDALPRGAQGRPQPGATAPATRAGAAPAIDARHYADAVGLRYEARPNSTFRKTIAKRLTESKQTIPHFYLTVDCAIDALLELRKRYNASADGSAKVSVNDFVIRAAALALRKVPDANVSWTDDAILAYADVDISVAVATPNGLITPIVKSADTKSLRQIGGEMRDLAARARDGKLKPAEYQGGTFSISNLGMFGVREFAAVINPPQSCILAVGNGEARAVVKDGQVSAATLMTCTLSVDHRAVDGAVGAEYLAAFKTLVEDPYSLLL